MRAKRGFPFIKGTSSETHRGGLELPIPYAAAPRYPHPVGVWGTHFCPALREEREEGLRSTPKAAQKEAAPGRDEVPLGREEVPKCPRSAGPQEAKLPPPSASQSSEPFPP